MPYRYYLINRPPGYAHNPDGFTAFECWIPAAKTDDPLLGERRFLGWVEYALRLNFEKVYGHELLPANPVERAFYNVWLDNDHDTQKAGIALAEYLILGTDELTRLANDPNASAFNDYYQWALTILQGEMHDKTDESPSKES